VATPEDPVAARSRARLLGSAARRFMVILVLVVFGTAICSLLIGLALGASVSRGVSLGFYLVGSFLLISGFFVGNRGPVRVKGDPGFGMFGIFKDRRLRWASGAEQVESMSLSLVFVALGIALIALGVAADARYSLV